MAKKLAGATANQQEFEAEGFPEKPHRDVQDALGEFLTVKRAHAKTGEKLATKHEALIETMHKHGVTRVRLDGENKFVEIVPKETATVKTMPKEKREKRNQAEANGEE